MIDTSVLSALTMEVMEAIDAEYGDDFAIRTAAIIVEVDSPTHGQFVVRSTEDRPWVLEAFIHEAENCVIDMRAIANAAIEDDDE